MSRRLLLGVFRDERDILGVTDHNGVSHHAAYAVAAGSVLVVPGVEVTTYRGHWNAWGTDVPHDFLDASDEAVETAMRAAAASGAVVSVNHPKPLGPAWEYERARGYHAIEAWNGPWALDNDRSLRSWNDHLTRGERIVAVGGSDAHEIRAPGPRRLGLPTTWIRAGERPTVPAVLEAIRRGDVFLSVSPAGPQIYLEREGDAVRARVVGARGATLRIVADGAVAHVLTLERDDAEHLVATPEARYVRAEVRAPDGSVLALSNARWRSSPPAL